MTDLSSNFKYNSEMQNKKKLTDEENEQIRQIIQERDKLQKQIYKIQNEKDYRNSFVDQIRGIKLDYKSV